MPSNTTSFDTLATSNEETSHFLVLPPELRITICEFLYAPPASTELDLTQRRRLHPRAHLLQAFPEVTDEMQPIYEAAVRSLWTQSIFVLDLVAGEKSVHAAVAVDGLEDRDLDAIHRVKIKTTGSTAEREPLNLDLVPYDDTAGWSWNVVVEGKDGKIIAREACFLSTMTDKRQQALWARADARKIREAEEKARRMKAEQGAGAASDRPRSVRGKKTLVEVRGERKRADLKVIIHVCLQMST